MSGTDSNADQSIVLVASSSCAAGTSIDSDRAEAHMRQAISCVAATIVLFGAGIARAQTDWRPTPAPQISALADWQIQGDPVFYSGDFYDPTGPDVFFEGNVMVRTGVFRGLPLYTDTTRQPFSTILVP